LAGRDPSEPHSEPPDSGGTPGCTLSDEAPLGRAASTATALTAATLTAATATALTAGGPGARQRPASSCSFVGSSRATSEALTPAALLVGFALRCALSTEMASAYLK